MRSKDEAEPAAENASPPGVPWAVKTGDVAVGVPAEVSAAVDPPAPFPNNGRRHKSTESYASPISIAAPSAWQLKIRKTQPWKDRV